MFAMLDDSKFHPTISVFPDVNTTETTITQNYIIKFSVFYKLDALFLLV
jgi:hypothetical protein